MDRIVDIASYILLKYEECIGKQPSEKKLHNLLYLTQRESLALLGTPAYTEPLEGWAYGPVSREVRSWYQTGRSTSRASEVSSNIKYIVSNVLAQYGSYSDQKLSNLTRKETSWIASRQGLGQKEAGSRYLKLDDIQQDSEKVRPYDYILGMYYDEYEDLAKEVI